MKLFIVAALVSVAAAGRLEHLERGYLPPDHSHNQAGFNSQGFQGNGFGSQGHVGSGSFGAGSNGHGASSFDSNGLGAGSAGSSSHGFDAASFPEATSNQYLPPDHGPSGSNGQFSGSLTGVQRSQYTPQSSFGSASHSSFRGASQSSFGGASQYNTPNQYGSASGGLAQPHHQQQYSNGGSNQFAATNRQYLAPKPSSYPQQSFDEQTGYHY